MTNTIPDCVLAQHIAILGKTGSGKTSTAKLVVEQIVRGGGRVCILDPIKSDHWGLTSSANGKQAGLPFHILGGPHGHVPVHAQAGKAIAEIVGNGSLPLSIIDMADFGPGGQSTFFIDFASTLLRKMRGVLYLVMEEAHLFAPKERSGIGNENMAIHWAKTMAQAGRSKGIRLIVMTQRTQALHNAILGSCDTIIVHRLTAPADQKPVLDWLAANTDKETTAKVASSLSSLKTGQGWICSGEARLFEQRQFPRISTYDNTATPTGDASEKEIRTAPVDQDKLRTLIGAAVEEAKANDPKELRRQLAEQSRQITDLTKQLAQRPAAEAVRVEVPVLSEEQNTMLMQATGSIAGMRSLLESLSLDSQLAEIGGKLAAIQEAVRPVPNVQQNGHSPNRSGINVNKTPLFVNKPVYQANGRAAQIIPARQNHVSDKSRDKSVTGGDSLTPRQQRFLDAAATLSTLGTDVTRETVSAWVGVHPRGGSVGEELKSLVDGGYILMDRGRITVTDAGADAAGQVDPGEAIDRAKSGLSTRQAKFFESICRVYPGEISREEIAAEFELHPRGGSLGEDLGRLVGRGLVEGSRGRYRARDFLFAGR